VRSAVLQDMLSVRPSVCYVWISKKTWHPGRSD